MRENIKNIPNFLTFLRVVLSVLLVYIIFSGAGIIYIIIIFVAAMLTDCLDGYIARHFNMKTEFGRNFDIIADRILMGGAALAIVVKFALDGVLTSFRLTQFILIMSREIICLPFIFLGLIIKKAIPQVRFIGKLTTFLQAFSFPLTILSVFYKFFSFSIYLAIVNAIVGAIAAFYYITDLYRPPRPPEQIRPGPF